MMNELIQELSSEAEDYADSIVDQGGEFHPAYTQKLAELIVKECLGACSKQAADWEGEYADAHNDGVGSCISGIKEHFGVEWESDDVS
jgi:hypothetical protein